jgi:hypothetical protein
VYYVLDDNRVYRLTEAPSPLPARSQKKSSQRRRSNKRRRVELTKEDEYLEPQGASELEDDGLGGMTWECLAVTLDDLKLLLESFRKSKDENEKILRRQLQDHLLPILEKQEESRKRKAQQRERELLNLAKMANAKRSSRIANKVEQQKQDEKEKEELILHRKTEEARRQQEQKQHKIEQERDSRLASRENRLKEREARRHRHEEDLAQLSEDSKHVDDGSSRISERRIHAEIEKNRQALKELDEEDEDWVFDCICGLYGQVDDGEHSVACEKCNVWQHSKCLGIHETEAERVDFHFICQSCSRHNADADERPRTTIKLKINRTRTESLQPIAGKFEYEGTNNDTPVVVPKPSEPSVTISTQEETSEPVATESEPNTNGYRHGSGATQSIHTLADESDPLRKDVGSSTAPTPSSTLPATSLLGEKLGILGSANPPNNVAPEVDSLHQSVTGHQDFVPDSSGENVNIPSGGGLSPTKHSPSGTLNEGAPNSAAKAFHSGVTLSPNPTATILTPPTKPTEPSRPAWHR